MCSPVISWTCAGSEGFAGLQLDLEDPAAGFEGPAVSFLPAGVFSTLSFLWRDLLALCVTSCSILFLMATSKPCTTNTNTPIKRYYLTRTAFKPCTTNTNTPIKRYYLTRTASKRALDAYLLQLMLLDHASFLGSDEPSWNKEDQKTETLNCACASTALALLLIIHIYI